MKLGKIRRSVRIVRTVRTENGFTDRTNRTVRDKDLRIVNKFFNRLRVSSGLSEARKNSSIRTDRTDRTN